MTFEYAKQFCSQTDKEWKVLWETMDFDVRLGYEYQEGGETQLYWYKTTFAWNVKNSLFQIDNYKHLHFLCM
jgi:hypothetical protein